MHRPFRDRGEAGRELAARLAYLAGRHDVLVLALPRGGVPVGFEIATALGARLDVLNVRKLGVPWQPELAMGALASGGVVVRNESVIAGGDISAADLDEAIRRERAELDRREIAYREGRPLPAVDGAVVVLVDDGIATGATMRAALTALRQQAPAAIVLAVPVGPPSTMRALARLADECVCLQEIEPLYSIGMWYVHFPQVSDDEVRDLLRRAGALGVPTPPLAAPGGSALGSGAAGHAT